MIAMVVLGVFSVAGLGFAVVGVWSGGAGHEAEACQRFSRAVYWYGRAAAALTVAGALLVVGAALSTLLA